MHNDYELLNPIGKGPLGTVYRGHDLIQNRPVAVKVLHASVRTRLQRRDDSWDRLRQVAQFSASRRDMVPVRDIDLDSGWIVSDLMRGRVRLRHAVAPKIVAGMMRQVLRPLSHLHTDLGQLHGAIHRRNLLYDDDGYVRLADPRGMALGVPSPLLNLCATSGNPGSDETGAHVACKHMAPEWFDEDFGPVGPASDLYALGLTALELLMGRRFARLFRGIGPQSLNPADSWDRWHRDPARALPGAEGLVPGLPEDLVRVVDGLTRKQVAERYQSALEVLDDLSNYRKIIPIRVKTKTRKTSRHDDGASRPTPAQPALPAPARHGPIKPCAGRRARRDGRARAGPADRQERGHPFPGATARHPAPHAERLPDCAGARRFKPCCGRTGPASSAWP